MARPRTPTNILEMRGAFKKNPKRARQEEPKPEKPLGAPPKRLSREVKAIWREIDRNCAPGVLTNMDRRAVEVASVALERIQRDPDAATMADLRTALTMLGKFGMTPSDRAGLSIAKK